MLRARLLCWRAAHTVRVQSLSTSTSSIGEVPKSIVRPSRTTFTNYLWDLRQNALGDKATAEQRLSNEEELIPRRMHDSYVEGILAFTQDEELRAQYANNFGGLRLGRIMEDLDAFSGLIAFYHCSDRDWRPRRTLTLVTASVDRMQIINGYTLERDLRLSGHVTYVGRSSLQIVIRVESDGHPDPAAVGQTPDGWTPILMSKFTFVALDPRTGASKPINPLEVKTDTERAINEQAKRDSEEAKFERAHDVSRETPSQEEFTEIHKTWARVEGLHALDPWRQSWILNHRDERYVYPGDTGIRRTNLCHPQEANMHNSIFGGYLMRESFDLAFSNATLFLSARPQFLYSSRIVFRRPVPVGSILDIRSQVVFCDNNASAGKSTFDITVAADVVDTVTKERDTTCVFNYTFCNRNVGVAAPNLVPQSYGDAVRMVSAARQHLALAQHRDTLIHEFSQTRLHPAARHGHRH